MRRASSFQQIDRESLPRLVSVGSITQFMHNMPPTEVLNEATGEWQPTTSRDLIYTDSFNVIMSEEHKKITKQASDLLR